MAKYQLGIIYLLRDRFQIFTPGMPSILEFRFVPEIIRDLDVVNKELLFNLLKIFIANNQIPKSSLIIVISDSASIIKDFTSPPEPQSQPPQLEQIHKEADEFLEHVPFEEVSSKSIPLTNGIRAYATNKDLYESIKDSFIHEGYEVLWVLPAIAIGPQVNTKAALDAEAINTILNKAPVLKEFNLLKQPLLSLKPEESQVSSTENLSPGKKSDKKRIILLVGVFVVLIIVLIFVYLNQA